jgi:hypothetical protein
MPRLGTRAPGWSLSDGGTETVRVAWLMTDYPKNSQTFNYQKIVSIEKHGVEVVPIALNPPDESDLEQPEHRRAHARTFYLKRIPKSKALAITALATDPERGLALSAAARRRVEELYDTRKMTLHLLETIQAAAQDSLASG